MDDVRHPDPASRQAFRNEVLRRLGEIPGVVAVGISKTLPLAGGGEPYTFTVGEREVTPTSGAIIVTPGYFDALRIPVLSGRTFTAADDAAPLVVVVNRAFARHVWPGRDPVGETMDMGEELRFTVIGMVGDVRHDGLAAPAGPAMYVPATVFSRSTMKLFVRTQGDPMRLAPAVREAIASIDPAQPVSDVAALPAVVAETVARPRLVASLVGLFGALAALLAALGLYGVVSYAVGERTHEIGIRMALGARRRSVLALVVGQGTALAAVGVVAGLLASLAAARLLRGLLFGVEPNDPATLAGAALLLLAAALAASWLPAYRAARVDPAEAIRYE
jgi:putative ABC transport system permease protein